MEVTMTTVMVIAAMEVTMTTGMETVMEAVAMEVMEMVMEVIAMEATVTTVMEVIAMEVTETIVMETMAMEATTMVAMEIMTMEIITREDMEVIMITLDTTVVIEITTMVLGIIVMEVMVTVKVGVIEVVVTAVVDTAERKDLCTIDLCTILWFMELKATMVKDSRHLLNMQPWDLGHIVEPVAGEDFLVSGDTPTTVSPGLEVCSTTRSLTIMPIIWQIFLASTVTNLNIIKILIVFYVFLIKI